MHDGIVCISGAKWETELLLLKPAAKDKDAGFGQNYEKL